MKLIQIACPHYNCNTEEWDEAIAEAELMERKARAFDRLMIDIPFEKLKEIFKDQLTHINNIITLMKKENK